MQDVQSSPSQVAMGIDRVGVRGLKLPVRVRDRAKGVQHTVAEVDLSVDLPAEFKGTHMSRFVEALENWSEDLDHQSMTTLLRDVRTRLQARRSHLLFTFPYFMEKQAPATGSPGLLSYDCRVSGELEHGQDQPNYELSVETPVMTVCPCSLAICDGGAHSQRAAVRISCRFTGLVWLEDLIAIAEGCASSPVYTLLKREDEKAVTETAFANPTFVEDAVRNAAAALAEHPQMTWFRVEVESFESIHNHNAFAAIEQDLEKEK
ncbi:MAG: GTP cyclohydrolase I FolE2 [Desulfovibrio sp.]|nr:MAG: GTP cyclohydrolase I FolE2 [Desulfovibrio sp.]